MKGADIAAFCEGGKKVAGETNRVNLCVTSRR